MRMPAPPQNCSLKGRRRPRSCGGGTASDPAQNLAQKGYRTVQLAPLVGRPARKRRWYWRSHGANGGKNLTKGLHFAVLVMYKYRYARHVVIENNVAIRNMDMIEYPGPKWGCSHRRTRPQWDAGSTVGCPGGGQIPPRWTWPASAGVFLAEKRRVGRTMEPVHQRGCSRLVVTSRQRGP